jgi:hypothetical protein
VKSNGTHVIHRIQTTTSDADELSFKAIASHVLGYGVQVA